MNRRFQACGVPTLLQMLRISKKYIKNGEHTFNKKLRAFNFKSAAVCACVSALCQQT